MCWFHSHAHHWTDLCIARGVLFPLARPGSHANVWGFVLPKPCPLQVEEGYLSTSGRRVFVHEKIRKLLGKKRNGVPGSHKQQMSTIIFYMIILLGPSVLVSNANMSMRWFSHLHFPTCCFLSLNIGSHQFFHPLKDFLSFYLSSAPRILEALRDCSFPWSICW